MASLSNKFALVTGGSRGIGAAIAKRLAKDGAHVLVNYARSKDAAQQVVSEIAAAGGKATAVQGDVSSAETVAKLFAEIDKVTGGKLDILINNAGAFTVNTLAQDTIENYDAIMNTNVRGVFLVTKAAEPRLQKNGRIVIIGSVLGEVVMGEGMAVYAASKFALHGLSRGWARDLAPRGITVNIVAPGPINTDMNPDSGPMADAMRSMIPLGRYGHVDEVASTVAYLASPEASFVSASAINVGGAVGS